MKINTFIAVAMCLLVATYIEVMHIQPDELSDMTKCIPRNTLAYFEQHNPATLSESVSISSFERKIQTIDFAAVAQEIGVAEETITWIRHLARAVKSMQNDPLIQKICGHRFALAILPSPDNSLSSRDKADILKDNLVIIAEPQDSEKVLRSLISAFPGSDSGVVKTTSQYGHHRILRIVWNGQPYALVVLDHLVLIGQNERQVRRCIDTFDGELPSFSDNTEILAFKSNFSAFDSSLVLPFKNIGDYLPAVLDGYDFSGITFLPRESSLLAGITGLFYGVKKQESIFKEKILVHYESQSIDNLVRDQLAIRPIKPSRFFLASTQPMFYLWSNSFDLRRFSKSTGHDSKKESSDTGIVTRLESDVSKDLKQLNLFGKEVTVIAEQGAENSTLSLPLAMIFVPVVDKDTLKATLQDILDTYDIPVDTESYGSVEYTYWSQSPQDNLLPLYGFWGEYFFLGNSATLLQKIIDANSRGLSLLDIDSVKKIDPGLAEENNLVVYSNNIQLINILEIVLKALGTIVAIEDRGFAVKAQVVINKIVLPLLEEAKMFDSSVIRSYFTPEMIVVDAITTISPHPSGVRKKNE